MTVRRWGTTTAAVLGIAALLRALAPMPSAWAAAWSDPQLVVDTGGPDELVVLVAWALAAACWVWGVVGLLLTAASTGGGPTGRFAATVLALLLPPVARRAAAVAIGVSLVATPMAIGPLTAPAAAVVVGVAAGTPADDGGSASPGAPDWSAEHTAAVPVWSTKPAAAAPVWSSGTTAPAPDWPGGGIDEHVVLRGECLWDIASAWLAGVDPTAAPPTDAQVAEAARAWWQVNAAVIGADPDLLLPGQVLRPPAVPLP